MKAFLKNGLIQHEDFFWDVIDESALKASKSQANDFLIQKLAEEDLYHLIFFEMLLRKYLEKMLNSDIPSIFYYFREFDTIDHLEEFVYYIISRGRSYYFSFLEDIQFLFEEIIEPSDVFYMAEYELQSVVDVAYQRKLSYIHPECNLSGGDYLISPSDVAFFCQEGDDYDRSKMKILSKKECEDKYPQLVNISR